MFKSFSIQFIPLQFISKTSNSDESILEYLKANNLSHLIRSNEYVEDGFRFRAKEKCINVFSSSRYLGKFENECAVICVDRPKIRVVKLHGRAGD